MYLIWILVAIPIVFGIYGIYVARQNVIERERDARANEAFRLFSKSPAAPSSWTSNDEYTPKRREGSSKPKLHGSTL